MLAEGAAYRSIKQLRGTTAPGHQPLQAAIPVRRWEWVKRGSSRAEAVPRIEIPTAFANNHGIVYTRTYESLPT